MKYRITIDANDQTKVYGDEDPDLTYVPELVDGCTITGELDRVEGEDVGVYNITVGTLASDPNCSLFVCIAFESVFIACVL